MGNKLNRVARNTKSGVLGLSVIGLLWCSSGLYGQFGTLWLEDFSGYTNNAATGQDNNLPVGPDWTSTATDCDGGGNLTGGVWVGSDFWGVDAVRDYFLVNDIEGGPCNCGNGGTTLNFFNTEAVDISAFSYVRLTIPFRAIQGTGFECVNPNAPGGCYDGDDVLWFMYRVDGGPWTTFDQNGYKCGGPGVPQDTAWACFSNTGNTVEIRIQVGNKADDEFFIFDDVRVEGANSFAGVTGPAASPITMCKGDSIQLTASGGSVYRWIGNINGLSCTTCRNPWVTPGVSGTYTVEVTTPGGCIDTASFDIDLYPEVNAVPSFSPVCQGGDIQLSGQPAGQSAYEWTGPNGFNANVQNPTVFNSASADAGDYWLTITTPDGCKDSSNVTVIYASSPVPTASQSDPICSSDTVFLYGGPNGMSSYHWTGPDGFDSWEQDPFIKDANPAVHGGMYRLRVDNGVPGCVDSLDFQLQFLTPPVAEPLYSDSICPGDTLFFYANPNGMESYRWTGPGGFDRWEKNPFISDTDSATHSGTYQLWIDVGISGCVDSATLEVDFLPRPNAWMSDGDTVCAGEGTPLTFGMQGESPFDLVITRSPDGDTIAGLNGISPPYGYWVSPDTTTTFTLISVSDQFCTRELERETRVVVVPKPMLKSVEKICNDLGTEYYLEVTLDEGASQYTVAENAPGGIGGNWNSNVWTSNEMPTQTTYEWVFSDTRNCGDIVVAGDHDCDCITDVGTADVNGELKLCHGDTAWFTHHGDEVLDPNDLLEFVLHTGTSGGLGTIIKRSDAPWFVLDTTSMQYGMVYCLAAIAGNDNGAGHVDNSDPCMDVSLGLPVSWYEEPGISWNSPDTVCPETDTTVIFSFTGTADRFELVLDNQAIETGATYLHPVNSGTSLTFNLQSIAYADYPSCTQVIDTTFVVETYELPDTANFTVTCTNTQDQYIIAFDGISGEPPYVVSGLPGTWSGNHFTSGVLDAGTMYQFGFTDAQQCITLDISGVKNCQCITDAGTANNPPLMEICAGQDAIYTHNQDHQLDGNDTLEFWLHDGRSDSIGKVLQRNYTGRFSYDPALSFNQSYWVTAVAGNYNGTGVDSLDPCFDEAVSVEVIFRELPSLTTDQYPNDSICPGDEALWIVRFTGTPPFQLDYFDGSAPMTFSTTRYLDTIRISRLSEPTTYSVNTISDLYCSTNANYTVQWVVPPPIQLDITASPISCSYTNDGALGVEVTGGYGNNAYRWEDSTGTLVGNTAAINNLGENNYRIGVVDLIGCTAADTFDMQAPDTLIFNFIEMLSEICFQDNNGKVTASISDGEQYRLIHSQGEQRPWQDSGVFVSLHYSPGINILNITARNSAGCEADSSLTIDGLWPITLFHTTDTLLCPDDSVKLQAFAEGGNGDFRYFWDGNAFVDSVVAENDTSGWVVAPEISAEYTIYALDSNQCPSVTEKIRVDRPQPLAQIPSPNDSLCSGEDIWLQTIPSGGMGDYNHAWVQADGDTLATGPTYLFNLPETERMVVTTSDGCGSEVSDTIAIYVAPPHELEFTIGPQTEGCAPLDVAIRNQSGSGGNYTCLWTVNGNQAGEGCGGFDYVFDKAGSYQVELQVTDQWSCRSNQVFGPIQPYANALANFSYLPSELDILNTRAQLSNRSVNALNFRWWLDGELLSSENAPVIEFPVDREGVYELCLEALNANGCHDTICKPVRVRDRPAVYAPNAFTPDNDGLNELFLPVIYSASEVVDYELLLYDRWGELLFETTSTDMGWNGKYRGEAVPTGVYTWRLRFRLAGMSQKHLYTGIVHVLR